MDVVPQAVGNAGGSLQLQAGVLPQIAAFPAADGSNGIERTGAVQGCGTLLCLRQGIVAVLQNALGSGGVIEQVEGQAVNLAVPEGVAVVSFTGQALGAKHSTVLGGVESLVQLEDAEANTLLVILIAVDLNVGNRPLFFPPLGIVSLHGFVVALRQMCLGLGAAVCKGSMLPFIPGTDQGNHTFQGSTFPCCQNCTVFVCRNGFPGFPGSAFHAFERGSGIQSLAGSAGSGRDFTGIAVNGLAVHGKHAFTLVHMRTGKVQTGTDIQLCLTGQHLHRQLLTAVLLFLHGGKALKSQRNFSLLIYFPTEAAAEQTGAEINLPHKVGNFALRQIQHQAVAGDPGVDPVHGVDHEIGNFQHTLVCGAGNFPAFVQAVHIAALQALAGIALFKVAPDAGVLITQRKHGFRDFAVGRVKTLLYNFPWMYLKIAISNLAHS